MIQYAPVVVNSGLISSTVINGYPDTQVVVIYNESPYFINVQFVGSGSFALAAFTADLYPISGSFSGTINIMPTTYLNNTNSNPPASSIYIQSYGSNDLLTKNVQNNVSTGYPIALVRQVNSDVGNAVTLTNTGYPSGTVIFYALPVGDTNTTIGAVNIKNNGQVSIGDTANPNGNITAYNTAGSASLDTIDSLGYESKVGAQYFTLINNSSATVYNVDSAGNLTCANGKTEVTFGGGNETHIVNLAGSDIAFYNGLTQTARITNAGTFKFGNGSQGSITAISKFGSYGITNVMTYYNHNLGVVPDLVLLQLVGNNQGTCTYDDGSMTTTQVKIAGSLASGLFVRGLAIKF